MLIISRYLTGKVLSILRTDFLSREQSASRVYILPPGCSYGGQYSLFIQPFPEPEEGFVVTGLQGGSRYGMEPDQVNAAAQSVQQPGKFPYMPFRIVQIFEYNILE